MTPLLCRDPQRPVFVDRDGVRHVGRIPPLHELRRLVRWADTARTEPETLAFAREVCRVMDLPAEKVLDQPSDGIVAAVLDFLWTTWGHHPPLTHPDTEI